MSSKVSIVCYRIWSIEKHQPFYHESISNLDIGLSRIQGWLEAFTSRPPFFQLSQLSAIVEA